jgi:hypothetical protein
VFFATVTLMGAVLVLPFVLLVFLTSDEYQLPLRAGYALLVVGLCTATWWGLRVRGRVTTPRGLVIAARGAVLVAVMLGVLTSLPHISRALGRRPELLTRLKARDNEPTRRPSGVDQLLGGETRSRSQVGEVALHRARSDSHEVSGVLDRSAGGDKGREHVHLALRRPRREDAAQVSVRHASRLAAASHSSRPSIGMS